MFFFEEYIPVFFLFFPTPIAGEFIKALGPDSRVKHRFSDIALCLNMMHPPLPSFLSGLFVQVRFILAVVEGRLKVSNRKKVELLAELKREGYDLFLPT